MNCWRGSHLRHQAQQGGIAKAPAGRRKRVARLGGKTIKRGLRLQGFYITLREKVCYARNICPGIRSFQVRSFGGLQLLFQQLPLVEICVFSVECDQFLMSAALDDAAVVENTDKISILDRRDTVR